MPGDDSRRKWLTEFGRVFKFGLAGVASLGIVLGVTSAGVTVGLETHLAYGLALCTAIGTNFLICRWFIFETHGQPLGSEFLRFVASVGVWRLVEFAGFIVLFDWFGVSYQVAVVSLAMVMFVVKFVWCRVFVFRDPEEAASGEAAV